MNNEFGTRKSINNFEFGKIPPQDVDVERAVLSALMIENDTLYRIPFIKAEMFYKQSHALIMEAITQMDKARHPIDLLTLTNQLRINETLDLVGGGFFLMELNSVVSSAANIEYHARIVQEKFISRELILKGSEIVRDAYDGTQDTLELLFEAEKKITAIANENIDSTEASNKDLIKEIKKDMKIAAKGGVVGLSTGLKSIDDYYTFEGGSIYMTAGTAGSGKTSISIAQAKSILNEKKHVVFTTLEMSEKQLIRWFLVAYGAKYRTVKYGTFIEDDKEIFDEAVKAMSKANLHITGSRKLDDIISDARLRHRDGEIDILIVDYIQKITISDGKKNTTDTLQTIMDDFKALAKELNIPIILISQLNRGVKKRSSENRPQLDDLRGSGALEEGSDVVSFIHRAAVYNTEGIYTINGIDVSCIGLIDVIIEKNKDGKTGDVFIKHSEDVKQFYDYDNNEAHSAASVFDDYSSNSGIQPNQQFESRKSMDEEEVPF